MERAFQTRSSVKEVLGSFRRGTFSSLTPVELNFNVAENFDVCFIKANVACDVFVGGDLRAAGMPRPHKALAALGKLSALLRSNGIKKSVAPVQLKQSSQSSLRMSIDTRIVSNCRFVVFSRTFFLTRGNLIRYCSMCNLASIQNVWSAPIFDFDWDAKENAFVSSVRYESRPI